MSSSLVLLKTRRSERADVRQICRGSNVLPLVWKLGEGESSSGVVLVFSPWFKITRSVTNRPRVDLKRGVNKSSPIYFKVAWCN
ncbi:hypothetical protein TNCV_2888831 [Trichonephila clavipes]|nr:hypothetical protein TNCV_2888831 [Trichonephila clavipes]